MNVRKQVVEGVKKVLENKRSDINAEIRRNKRQMQDLVMRQTILKRSLPALTKLIRDLG